MAAARIIDNLLSIERIPDKSSIFSVDLYALHLALEMVEDDERNFIFFFEFKVCPSDPLGSGLDTSSRPQGAGTPSMARTVPLEKNILLDSKSCWHSRQ